MSNRRLEEAYRPIAKGPHLVHVSSCADDSIEANAIQHLIKASSQNQVLIVTDPALAHFVICVGVRQDGAFANLRLNPVWRRWPEKCFVYHETYNPPTLLHGICSSIPQWKNWFGRFRSFGYPLLTHLCPNPVPDGLFGIKEPKRYLFSFVGRWSHAVRRRLFAHSWPDDVFVRCSHDTYSRFIRAPEKDSRAEEVRYWQTMAASKFALCPRGAGVSSIRLFEAMSIGVAPIIVADGWVPPVGPRWDRFALFVPERDVRHLAAIVRTHETEWEERGRLAYAAYNDYFRPEHFWPSLFVAINSIQQKQRVPERLFGTFSWALTTMEWIYQAGWSARVKLVAQARSMRRRCSRDTETSAKRF
jgi:hypothetical protein